MRKSCGIVVGFLIFTVASHADNIVNIYSDFTCCSGGGAPFSNLVGTIDSPDVLFLTDNALNWHPFSLDSFGADILGTLDVASPGNYTFTLNSDDGSLLFIDGGLVVDHGGLTPVLVNATGSVALSAGPHPFEVQFFECCGGDSGVDLYLPDGISYGSASVPEPSGVMLLLIGLVVLVWWHNRTASPRQRE